MRRPGAILGSLGGALALLGALAASASAAVGFHRPITLPRSRDGTEPSIAISARGVRYAAWQVPGELATSRNGIDFTQRGFDPVPDPNANGDVSNAVDRAGAIYNGQICGDAQNVLHSCIYRSTNGGRTWRKTELADNNPGASDRPWIAVHSDPRAPRNPDRDTVYLEYHTFTPDDLTYVTVSHDGGATFGPPVALPLTIESANGSACNTYPGGIVVDQRTGAAYAVWNSGDDAFSNATSGCNYSSLGPFTRAWVAASTDGGTTWRTRLAWHGSYDPVTHVGDDNDQGFITIAVDRRGQVHVIMAVRHHNDPVEYTARCTIDANCVQAPQITDLQLVTSPDRGAHWTRPVGLSRRRGSYFFPYMVAGAAGRLGVDYYRTRSLRPNDPADVWYVGFTEVRGAVARLRASGAYFPTHPTIATELSIDPKPVHKGGICTLGIFCPAVPNSNRNLADNIALALNPAGGVEAAWTNDYNAKALTRVDYACQSSGDSLYVLRGPRSRIHRCFGQRAARRHRPGTHGRPRRPSRPRFTG